MRHFTWVFFTVLFFLAGYLSSCQKEDAVPENQPEKVAVNVDSAKNLGANLLAVKGKLTVTLPDTTYSFDAATDSVAFINLTLKGQQYYGISAINKAHTLSFGISSLGTAAQGVAGTVAGSQLLISKPGKTDVQYTLTSNTEREGVSLISLDAYNSKDSTLAKGTFQTFIAKDDKPNSAFIKVKGTFDLHK